jgi:hypothetical protein
MQTLVPMSHPLHPHPTPNAVQQLAGGFEHLFLFDNEQRITSKHKHARRKTIVSSNLNGRQTKIIE